MRGRGSMTIEAAPKWRGECCERGAKSAVTVQRYHFHCVGGGGDAAFDLTGRWVSRLQEVRSQADRIARALMDAAPDTDWSGWLVDVHDARGRRALMRPFVEVLPQKGCEARRRKSCCRPAAPPTASKRLHEGGERKNGSVIAFTPTSATEWNAHDPSPPLSERTD